MPPSAERRRHRAPSQKVMLSNALQKARDAVLLDNAQENVSAVEAYREACTLLLQVMERSSGDEEKRKLETIVRYAARDPSQPTNANLLNSAIHTKVVSRSWARIRN